MKFKKNNHYKNIERFVFPVLIFLLIGGIFFYWYEIRPAIIKHDCSWVIDRHENAKEAVPAMTEAQLKEKGWLPDCNVLESEKDIENAILGESFLIRKRKILISNCKNDYQKKIEEYKKDQSATEARDVWRKTTNEEYIFCLHDKGL